MIPQTMYIQTTIRLHYPRHIRRPHRHLGSALENHVPNLWRVLGNLDLNLVDKRTVEEQ
jgi:hypothetical protein